MAPLVLPLICHPHSPYHTVVQQHLMEENSDLQRQLKEATDLAKLTETVTPLALPLIYHPHSLMTITATPDG